MLSLRDMQRGFARSLLSGVSGHDMPGIRADGLSPAQRLAFYRTNVFGNYLAALRATYRVTERLTGRTQFRDLAERFIRDCPSVSGDLNRYGAEFSAFLRVSAESRDLPHLADVAQLEWLMDECFYDADHPPLSLVRLASVPPECYGQLVFELHPACRLLRSDYAIRRIWQAYQPGGAGAAAADPEQGGERLLIRRERFEVVIDLVDAGEFAMLRAFRAGAGFETAYAQAHAAQTGFDPGTFLQRWVLNGVLVDFQHGEAGVEESFSAA
jgi:hypothetical protein